MCEFLTGERNVALSLPMGNVIVRGGRVFVALRKQGPVTHRRRSAHLPCCHATLPHGTVQRRAWHQLWMGGATGSGRDMQILPAAT